MKSQKLFVMAVIVCLLVGASGAAMARNDCGGADGMIVGEELEELVIDEPGVSCTVVGSTVNGNVRVSGIFGFTMKSTLVRGNLRVSALEVSLVDNQVEGGGNLSLGINGVSLVVNNVVKDGGNLRINDGIGRSCENAAKVYAVGNLVQDGNMRVNCTRSATVKQNTVLNGNISCRDNIQLDAVGNDSQGGTVNCSRVFSEE